MRLRLTPMLAFVAALALAIGACGGDDNKDSANGVTVGGQATQPPTGTTPPAGSEDSKKKKSSSSKSKSKSKERSSNSGSSGSSSGSSGSNSGSGSSDNKQPNRKTKSFGDSLSEANSPESQDKVSYAAARGVCAERPLSEIKKLYKPKGSSNEDIAKAVASFYRPAHRREAAHDGCLAGLKSR